MKTIFLLSILVAALCGCHATRPALPPSYTKDVASFRDVPAEVAHAERPVLLVLDIDDTLLTTPQDAKTVRKFFGSDRWFGWQYGLPANDPDKVRCLFDVSAWSYDVGSLVEAEDGEADLVRKVMVADTLIETSRNPATRAATVRELAAARYPLDALLKAGSNDTTVWTLAEKNDSGPTKAEFRGGMLMTNGAKKGPTLADLLKQPGFDRHYRSIVMVDDGASNLTSVASSASEMKVQFIGLRYRAVKAALPNGPSESEKSAARDDWAQWQTWLRTTYPDRDTRMTSSECIYH